MRAGEWRGATPSRSQRSNVVPALCEASPWWVHRLQSQKGDCNLTMPQGVNSGVVVPPPPNMAVGARGQLKYGCFFYSNICLSVFSMRLYFICNTEKPPKLYKFAK